MLRGPSDLRFLAALGLQMGADLDRIITDFQDDLADEGDDIAAIRQKK
jgi:hypothetical protein